MLALRITADHIAVVVAHRAVEEARRGGVCLIASDFMQSGEADDLGNLRVRVKSGKLVLLCRQRIEHGMVVDLARHAQPAHVTCQMVSLGIALVEAAVLRRQYALHLTLVQRFEHARQIGGDAQYHRHGAAITRQRVRIDQPGVDLVPGVERHPAAVEIDALTADLAAELLEDDLAVHGLAVPLHGGAAAIAVAMGCLDAGHLREAMVERRREPVVGRAGEEQRDAAKPVPERMAGDAERFPAAIARLRGVETGRKIEVVKQPLGVERGEIGAVRGHRIGEDRRLQTDPAEWRSLDGDRARNLTRKGWPAANRAGDSERARAGQPAPAADLHCQIASTSPGAALSAGSALVGLEPTSAYHST